MAARIPVYVALLDEGTDCWRLTSATRQADGRMVLTDENYDPRSEIWSVAPGSEVELVQEQLSDRVVTVAKARPERPQ
jgi:hypothetical protein